MESDHQKHQNHLSLQCIPSLAEAVGQPAAPLPLPTSDLVAGDTHLTGSPREEHPVSSHLSCLATGGAMKCSIIPQTQVQQDTSLLSDCMVICLQQWGLVLGLESWKTSWVEVNAITPQKKKKKSWMNQIITRSH